jgi:hypothetical protein
MVQLCPWRVLNVDVTGGKLRLACEPHVTQSVTFDRLSLILLAASISCSCGQFGLAKLHAFAGLSWLFSVDEDAALASVLPGCPPVRKNSRRTHWRGRLFGLCFVLSLAAGDGTKRLRSLLLNGFEGGHLFRTVGSCADKLERVASAGLDSLLNCRGIPIAYDQSCYYRCIGLFKELLFEHR